MEWLSFITWKLSNHRRSPLHKDVTAFRPPSPDSRSVVPPPTFLCMLELGPREVDRLERGFRSWNVRNFSQEAIRTLNIKYPSNSLPNMSGVVEYFWTHSVSLLWTNRSQYFSIKVLAVSRSLMHKSFPNSPNFSNFYEIPRNIGYLVGKDEVIQYLGKSQNWQFPVDIRL